MGCSPEISRGVSLLQDIAGDMEIRWGSCEEDLVLEGKTGIYQKNCDFTMAMRLFVGVY